MEVVIILHPLDRTEESEPRKLSLTKENRQVDVSRASKNPDRGLQPGPDNAVFHCPIMSRSHARLTASPVEKRVYIQDLGSTHGTFVGFIKLREGKETALASGDVVTFGVKITNGPAVYNAKAFRVEYSWQPRQTVAAPNPPVGRIFTVPDSDNEDEIASIHTREPSVQIMESKLRTTTYSVPSESDYGSDADDFRLEDDNFQTSSSPLGQSQDSAITTPEHYISRPSGDVSDRHDDLKGESFAHKLEDSKLQDGILEPASEGSSQDHPIDLAKQSAPDAEATGLSMDHRNLPQEQTQTKAFEEVDLNETESEDDGPEILPIQSRYKRSDLARTTRAVDESDVDEDDEESEEDDDGAMNDGLPPNVDETNDFNGAEYPDGSPMRCGRPSGETLFTQRVPSPSDAALARTSSKVEPMPRLSSMHSTDFPHPTSMFVEPPLYTWNAPPPATDYPVWRDDPKRPYQYNADPSFGYSVVPHGLPTDHFAQHPGPNAGQDAHRDFMTTHFVSSAEPLPREAPTMRSTDDPASKLHIANLVNSYPTDSSRPAKRKANKISLDTHEEEVDSAPLQLPTISQDSPLPDAQPRDAPIAIDTSVSIEETSTSSVHLNVAEVATRASLTEEPAPKKVKTSSVSSSGIGKFLMGVAVGAVGLAATFLATIPANVQEEVRLGL